LRILKDFVWGLTYPEVITIGFFWKDSSKKLTKKLGGAGK